MYFSDETDLNEIEGYDLTKAKVFDNFITEAEMLLYFGNPTGYEAYIIITARKRYKLARP